MYRSGDKQWFDASCRRAYNAKQTAYRAWCTAHYNDHLGQFVLARIEAQRVQGAAMESNNERARNTLKHSTCSNKWWETLKGSIFGVKPSFPALRRAESGLVVAPAENASILALSLPVSSVVSSLLLLCLVSLCLDVIIWPPELLSSFVCFLILIHIGVSIIGVCFIYF